MNDRIFEIAESVLTDQDPLGEVCREDLGYLFTGDELQRFAKLIVDECLNLCYNRGMNDELYAGQLKAAAYIEHYFGIER